MTELEFQAALEELIESSPLYDAEGEETTPRVTTFADGGLLTRNTGLIVSLPDGSEFQITIVRSA